jgi:RNA polymerase subunit RPABC4/transcription elongation factor Spt4
MGEADGRCARPRRAGWAGVRCVRCGALNPDGADWCGQCLMRFGTPIPLVAPARPEGAERAAPDPPEGVAGADGATSAPARPPDLGRTVAVRLVPSSSGRIRRVDGRLEWACPSCDEINPIDEQVCPVCGSPVLDLFRVPAPPRPPRRAGVALGLSLVPGLGCCYAGSLAVGLIRLLLAGTWLAALVVVWPRPEPALVLVKAVFLVALVGLWVVSAVDALRLAGRRRPLVDQRVLAVAAIALCLVLALGMMLSFGVGPVRHRPDRAAPGGPAPVQVPPGGGPGEGAG